MKGHRVIWTEAEKQFVFDNYKKWTKPELCRRMQAELGSDKTPVQLKPFYKKHKLCNGFNCKFEKGHVPENKGVPMSEETKDKIRHTWYSPGHRPYNAHDVGDEVLHKYKSGKAYWYVKVAEPKTWKPKHHLLWEQHYGPIKKDYIVIFLDGDTNNVTIENLRMISKQDNVRINQLYSSPDLSPEERTVYVDIVQIRNKVKGRKLK